ncbi:MAG: hypothetical protein JWR07_2918 [Nevskia sp.]|nr:hypothetical protein [Nevskia sp.]
MDIALLVIIALCQSACGYWAFHVSTDERESGHRWFFGGVTLLSVGLLVWSGIRSQESQKKNELSQQTIQSNLINETEQLSKLQNQNDTLQRQNSDLDIDLKRIANAAHIYSGESAKDLADEIIKKLPKNREIDLKTKSKIISELRKSGPCSVSIVILGTEPESAHYGLQLIELLKASGWDTANSNTEINGAHDPGLMGLYLGVKDMNKAPQCAADLLAAFRENGIKIEPSPDTAATDWQKMLLIVGGRP